MPQKNTVLNTGNGSFSYTSDYIGFNIPDRVLRILDNKSIKDFNKYDEVMREIRNRIHKLDKNSNKIGIPYYLIGVSNTEKNEPYRALKHEIAHAMYYLNKQYKNEIDELLNTIPNKKRELMKKQLKRHGYSISVFDDETQAYLATGIIYRYETD